MKNVMFTANEYHVKKTGPKESWKELLLFKDNCSPFNPDYIGLLFNKTQITIYVDGYVGICTNINFKKSKSIIQGDGVNLELCCTLEIYKLIKSLAKEFGYNGRI